MQNSKLSQHNYHKGVFSTPFGDFLKQHGNDDSWFRNRMPLYIWLGLILDKYGHVKGLEKCAILIKKLVDINPSILLPSFSEILSLPEHKQRAFFEFSLSVIQKSILSPLSVLYPVSTFSTFSHYLFIPGESIELRLEKMTEILAILSDHQSEISTDIRFLVIHT